MVEGVSAHNENTCLGFSKEDFSTLLRLLANDSPLSIIEAISRLRTKLQVILVINLK